MTPYFEQAGHKIYQGHVLDVLKSLPDESVQMCVTSPPYWGLRSYLSDDHPDKKDEIGLEKTPEEYIEKMVEIFREVRRVMRHDAVLFLNLGDSYSGDGRGFGYGGKQDTNKGCENMPRSSVPEGLKPKDLCGIPWRVALALQSDGWWLRSDIIWNKPNPMPESVTDRPTKSHEYIFLLTKSAKYFYDAEAIKVPAAESTHNGGPVDFGGEKGRNYTPEKPDPNYRGGNEQWGRTYHYNGGTVNKRTVWTIPTQPFPQSHFAVFPEKLVEPCILAGTSEKGCCVECGSPWERVVDYKANYEKRETAHAPNNCPTKVDSSGWKPPTIKQIGWQPSCKCDADTVPCTVCDIFGGAGTTSVVAHKHGRKSIIIELSETYINEIAIPRIKKATAQRKLF